jgi:hypothetical protein
MVMDRDSVSIMSARISRHRIPAAATRVASVDGRVAR